MLRLLAIQQANPPSRPVLPQLGLAVLVTAALALCTLASAAETPSFALELTDHLFQPAEITVPANQRIILLVTNNDKSVEEFESHDLKVEKIVAAGRTIKIRVGPLKPGRYKFEGEFHADTAQGVLIAQ